MPSRQRKNGTPNGARNTAQRQQTSSDRPLTPTWPITCIWSNLPCACRSSQVRIGQVVLTGHHREERRRRRETTGQRTGGPDGFKEEWYEKRGQSTLLTSEWYAGWRMLRHDEFLALMTPFDVMMICACWFIFWLWFVCDFFSWAMHACKYVKKGRVGDWELIMVEYDWFAILVCFYGSVDVDGVGVGVGVRLLPGLRLHSGKST